MQSYQGGNGCFLPECVGVQEIRITKSSRTGISRYRNKHEGHCPENKSCLCIVQQLGSFHDLYLSNDCHAYSNQETQVAERNRLGTRFCPEQRNRGPEKE